MELFYKILTSLFCRLWNRQYYKFPGISADVIFAPAFPGMIRIISPQNCKIGHKTVINAGAVIHCAGGVTIGKYVHIGHGLCIYSSNHNYASDKSIPYDEMSILKPVEINDCVWIGANVSIVPGVKTGEGAVIGMGAVVTHDVPMCAIVGGNPAAVIAYRDKETYLRLRDSENYF